MTDSCDAYVALCLLDRGQGRDARITAIKIQRYDTRCYTTNLPNTAICWEFHHSLSKTQFTHHKLLYYKLWRVTNISTVEYRLSLMCRSSPAINKRRCAAHQWLKARRSAEDYIKFFVRIDKSEAEVTNNKRGILPYCWITDRLEASRGLSATAELLVCCAMLCRIAAYAIARCLSVHLWRSCIALKRLNMPSNYFIFC